MGQLKAGFAFGELVENNKKISFPQLILQTLESMKSYKKSL